MDRSRIWRICKNYISIVLTLVVMIYFGFANSSMFHSFASELSIPETQEESIENVQEQTASVEENGTAVVLSESESTETAEEPFEGESTETAEEPSEGENTETAEEPSEGESTETAEEPNGSESPETTEESAGSEGVGDAKITYTYTVTDPEAENYGEEVTETMYFVGWSEIFAGIKAISDKMLQSGETQYVPTVELCRDMEQMETVQNVDNISLVLDMQGHVIRLSNGSYLDFGAGKVTFSDQTAATSQNRPGGIVGDGAKLITGSGEWIFYNGWYENASGSIFGEATAITVLDGYFISSGSYLAEKAETFNIYGGFFSFNESLGLVGYGQMNLLVEKAFAKMTMLLWERELTGYCLTEPDYVVSVGVESTDEAGNPVTVIQKCFYKEFIEAWEQAVALSLENDSSVATVKIINEQINGISLSRSYSLSSGDEGKTAAVQLDDMHFTRQSGYDGNLFTVNGGRLILNDCTLDCVMDEQSVALASAIRVNGGILVLNGSAGTAICNNVSIPNTENGDAGAGIYLASGAQMSLSGKVSIKDNLLYDPDAESEELQKVSRNLYIEEGAAIEIVGSMAADSRIGVSCKEDIIAGLTSFGKLSDSYFAEIKESTTSGEQPDLSGLLSVFVSDQYASYYACFDSERNLLFWDRSVLLLPEAGVLRIEFIFLLIGLLGFIVRNIPKISNKRAAERSIMVISVLCVFIGSGIGFYHIRQERLISDANMATLQEFYSLKESRAEKAAMNLQETEGQTEETNENETVSVCTPEDGREYYMVIEIPALEMKLPVLADYSEADMKTTPCVYSGTVSEDNLVIVGHNFESQFGRLNEIELGTDILLTLSDGTI